ncbi:MAG: deoxyguanosinetriphosphate triphosphohydrolase [Ruminococcus sp.]|nr:deoxyguanosinetriphosphate triphosphohydrolase [Ruminococcus sp.]
MEWNKLLCEKRQVPAHTREGDPRNAFEKDYHRILGSASFRRLQDKTQVFPLDKSDFVRTRLTHSLEVSSFAKSLGQMAFADIISSGADSSVDTDVKEKACSILECAGLLHDIGNPPFGHFGESSIRYFFERALDDDKYTFNGRRLGECLNEQMKADLLNFEGNAQALRLVTKLHYLVDEKGMHLTYALLNTLIKYPVPSTEIGKDKTNIIYKKMGYYLAEQELFEDITSSTGAVGCRYPLTFLLEAADDIAYCTADIEDAVRKGIISLHRLQSELERGGYTENASETARAAYDRMLEKLDEKYKKAVADNMPDPERNAVQNWVIYVQGELLRYAKDAFVSNYESIMRGEFSSELLKCSDGAPIAKALSDTAYRLVFRSKYILRSEITAGNMISFLLESFLPAAVAFDSGCTLSPMEDRLISIVSENYMAIYRKYSEGKDESFKLYLRMLLVTDFVCGMTDSYAKRLYSRMRATDYSE